MGTPGTALSAGPFHDPGAGSARAYNRTGMTDTRGASTEAATPLPDLVLYTRDGCHLCDDARDVVRALLAERGERAPRLVERDITTNDDWHRRYLNTIPVLELGDRRLELATSPAKIRRFLDGA
jgi:Glutaredoxin-like domain (DUF836)